MTDLEHPHVIRMIASFTGLDFGRHSGETKNGGRSSVSPTKKHQQVSRASSALKISKSN